MKHHLTERWKRRVEESEHGLGWMGLASFLESTVVPIPLEVVLIPYMIARRRHVWRIAAVVLAACLLGALVGYGIGALFMDTVGERAAEAMGWSQGLEDFQQQLDERGFWAVLAVGITPIPFQAAMLGAGAAGYSLPLFLLASALARGVRYFGLAALVRAFGERAESFWDDHATAIGAATSVLVLGLLAWSIWG